jgi:hypothetical protein
MEVDADATTPNFIATPRGRFSKGSYVNHRPFISQVFFLSLFLRNTDMWTQSGQWSLSRKKLAWSDQAVFVVVRSRCAVAWTPKKRSMTWVWLPGFWWVGFIRREPCAVCSFCKQNVHTATSPRECFAPTVATNRTRVTYRACYKWVQ